VGARAGVDPLGSPVAEKGIARTSGARQGYQRAGTKADPAGLQREGLGGASQREAARDQILPERPTCLGADPVVAE
jgi:hypothetical protein